MKSEIVFSGDYNYINQILEINSLSDAEYYIFIIVTSGMLRGDWKKNDLVSIIHTHEKTQEVRLRAINAYSKDYDFEKFMSAFAGEFYYLANNIHKNISKLYEGKYVFHVKDNVNVTVIAK